MGPTGGNMPHGQDAGFLGKSHDPFVLNADPAKPDFRVPDLLPPAEIGEARLDRRKKLREVVEGTMKNFEASPEAQLMNANFEAAYRLMTHPRARGFDWQEPNRPRALRHNRFGHAHMLARGSSGAAWLVTLNSFHSLQRVSPGITARSLHDHRRHATSSRRV